MGPDKQIVVPEVNSFEKLIKRAHDKVSSGRKPRAVLMLSSEGAMFRAFAKAADSGLIDPIIVGTKRVFSQQISEGSVGLRGTRIIDISQPEQAVTTVLQMASQGEIDMVVKGEQIATSDFLKLVFERRASFVSGGKMLCHISVIKSELYQKLLILTDGGVVVQPDLKQKLMLIHNAVTFARQIIGLSSPRVAILAAVEVIYPQMSVTTDAAILSKMADRGQIKGAFVDGPISFDCAVDMFAARSKGLDKSKVAGQADILIAPNIETAAGIYRAMALYGRAQIGGVLIGGKVPVALGTRSDSVETKYHSIVLGVLAAELNETPYSNQ
jgi:phosphate butyryltransferase